MPRELKRKCLAFWLCLICSIGLGIGGFFCPPMGAIDGSVLEFTGILLAFATIAQVPVIIESVGYIRMSKGDVTVEASKEAIKNVSLMNQDNNLNQENTDEAGV